MTVLRGTDDAGRVAEPLHPENLRILLSEAPVFVTIGPVDGSPEPAARAERDGAVRWSVQVSGAAGPLVASLPNTDATFDALRSWAAEDGWWEQAFSWRAVGD